MTPLMRVATALAAVALTVGTAGCDRNESSPGPMVSTADSRGLQDYLARNKIVETSVSREDPAAPTVALPFPPGWVDAGQDSPDWSFGAIVYATPQDRGNPPTVIAAMSKLVGNADPDRILDYTPGETAKMGGFTPRDEPHRLKVSGFDAVQSEGSYLKSGRKRAIIATTVAIPATACLYILQINADGPDGEQGVLAEASRAVDRDTTITVSPHG